MSHLQPTSFRPPLATRQRLNNVSVDTVLPLKRHWNPESDPTSLKMSEDVYVQHEDAKEITALENASRIFECAWNDCYAELGCWELLKRHVEKMHCEALSNELLGRATSSRPYRCCYASCQNRTFSDPCLLLQHVVSGHLESLKLRCPFGCKQFVTKLQPLVQHLSSAHGKTIYELPGAAIRPPPVRRASLPELPTSNAPMGLDALSHVKPCPTFDSEKVKAKVKKNPWADFEDFDDGEEIGRFAQLRMPHGGLMSVDLRTIPRGRIPYDGLPRTKRGHKTAQTQGETVGYGIWKRRFDEEAEAAEALEQKWPPKRKKS